MARRTARKWTAGEARAALRSGDVEARRDLGRRFPLFATASDDEIFAALAKLPYVTPRKLESVMRGDAPVSDEAAEDEETEEAEEEAPAPRKRGRPKKAEAPAKAKGKPGRKAKPKDDDDEEDELDDILSEDDDDEDDDDDDDEDEDEA